MPRPRILVLVVVLVAAASCKRDVTHLDDVQKMAYSVKPSVVRVNAFATADFRYPLATIRALEASLRADGNDVHARDAAGADGVVDTGAGGSGSGFIIHPDGV